MIFHDRRTEGRRTKPTDGRAFSYYNPTAKERQQEADERYHELDPSERYEGEEVHPEEGYEAEPSGENYPEKRKR